MPTANSQGKIGNGATISFAGTGIAAATSIKPDEAGQEIDLSLLTDTDQITELGQIQKSCEVTVIGSSALVTGAKGALSLTIPGATAEALGHFVLVKKGRTIGKNAELATALSFKLTRADT